MKILFTLIILSILITVTMIQVGGTAQTSPLNVNIKTEKQLSYVKYKPKLGECFCVDGVSKKDNIKDLWTDCILSNKKKLCRTGPGKERIEISDDKLIKDGEDKCDPCRKYKSPDIRAPRGGAEANQQ